MVGRKLPISLSDRVLYKAVAAVVEFILMAQESDILAHIFEPLEAIMRSVGEGSPLSNGKSLLGVALEIGWLYKWQSRRDEFDGIFNNSTKRQGGFLAEDLSGPLSASDEARLARLFGYSKCHVALVQESHDLEPTNWRPFISSVDILGWTPLHYAALRNPKFYEEYAMKLNMSARDDPKDIVKRTSLHYAARSGSWRLGQSLRKHSDINARGRDGMLPVH